MPRRPNTRAVRATSLVAAVVLAVSSTVVLTTPTRVDAVDLVSRTRSGAGPLGAITVIGDSVLLGSVYWGPTLDDHLVADGWGPVRVRAGVGENTVTTARRLREWRAAGWDPNHVVVNIGANDAAACGGSESCSHNAIMRVVEAIGAGKRIWWPMVTDHPVNSRHHAWNRALERVVDERPGLFFTWDWPTVMYRLGLHEQDHIHPTPSGARTRSALMADEITAALARGAQTGGPAPLPSPSAGRAELLPIGPTRVLDTRRTAPGRVRAGRTIEVDVSKHVPDDTTAIAAYITAVGPSDRGHLSAQPCKNAPTSSFTNYEAGVTRGAVTITPVSAGKRFCVTTHAEADIVIDLQAAFVSDALRFTPEPTPKRLRDTRKSSASRHLEIDVPDGATAVAVNLTAVQAVAPGHATIHPCEPQVPTAANLNYLAREVVASAAIVPVSPAGTICIDTHSLVDLVVDLTGTFSAGGDLSFVPVVPTRMLDTRKAIGGWTPIHGRGQVIEARVAPAKAQAVTGTMTLVAPLRNSHLQAWGCGSRQDNSNVNALAGAVLANFVTTGTTSGKLCVFAIDTGHTLFDTTGWWVP